MRSSGVKGFVAVGSTFVAVASALGPGVSALASLVCVAAAFADADA